jgi:hypothetical protein
MFVMGGLVPANHVFERSKEGKTWVPGLAGMTTADYPA